LSNTYYIGENLTRNKEKDKIRKHKWYLDNKEKTQLHNQIPEIAAQRKIIHSKWNKDNKDKTQKYSRNYRDKLTLQVITHYGGKCICCGETELKFLTIDHKNNDGAKERKKLSGRNVGTNNLSVYRLIVKNNYPDTYRVLCYNCNCGRERNNGICPHSPFIFR
jgi:hypothetical protein